MQSKPWLQGLPLRRVDLLKKFLEDFPEHGAQNGAIFVDISLDGRALNGKAITHMYGGRNQTRWSGSLYASPLKQMLAGNAAVGIQQDAGRNGGVIHTSRCPTCFLRAVSAALQPSSWCVATMNGLLGISTSGNMQMVFPLPVDAGRHVFQTEKG